ncbi:hypothetical protein [Streptomyces silvensis]|uniref:Uncharacterized protein n=1 Tax=Streptomyces silvensis TaxID=1765722 RepID=A0A0W7WWX6_9ACTN|nr:hypothetical protein [Streptomyces silvensis]KUF15052.1 hypothetical protein AT728_26650 [Streptomyces silvensis]
MSMHEIEDLVADSVRVLDSHAAPDDPRVRGWFAALYDFQSGYDCSFTHFRVLDALMRRGYTYRFPIDEHPDYAARNTYFDALTEFTGLRMYDEDDPAFAGYDAWLEDGYVDPPFLYCDAGTALWQRMAALGRLSGPDAAPPHRAPLIEAVREVAVAAEKEHDHDLIGSWYAWGAGTLLGGPAGCPFDVTELAGMPAVRDLRAVVARTGALAVAQRSPYAVPLDFADDQDLEGWWWRL